MSQENVEIVKEFTRLFEKGDRDKWREYFDPDVVWDTSASDWPTAGVLHGHEGVERFFRDWLGTWRTSKLQPGSTSMQGIRWWSSFAKVARAGRGVHIERDFFSVYDLRESKVVRYRMYDSREEAIEAAGLSE